MILDTQNVIKDADILEALQPLPGRSVVRAHSDYSLKMVTVVDGAMHVDLVSGSNRARVRFNLPSSGRPMPWLYSEPENAADWVGQLLVFVDEEVDTGGLGYSRVRETLDGVSHVVVTGYGFKLADTARHEKLEALAGPDGTWSGTFGAF